MIVREGEEEGRAHLQIIVQPTSRESEERSEAIRGNQRPRVRGAIRGNQRQSKAASQRSDPRQSEAIKGRESEERLACQSVWSFRTKASSQ